MDFQTAIKTCFSKYGDFTGRAQRAEYWWFVLFWFGVLALLNIVQLEAVAGIFSLVILIPSIAVAVRRLHDVGMSGWWYLLVLVPVLGMLALLYFFIQRGESGTNKYGPDPLADPEIRPT